MSSFIYVIYVYYYEVEDIIHNYLSINSVFMVLVRRWHILRIYMIKNENKKCIKYTNTIKAQGKKFYPIPWYVCIGRWQNGQFERYFVQVVM